MLGDSLRRRHGAGKTAHEKPGERPPRPERPRRPGAGPRFAWWHWLVAAGVVLAGSFGVGYLLSTQVIFPRPETAGTGIAVPALYGEMRTDAEAAIRDAGLVPGEVTEMASMDTERGRVLAQDPVPGQQLRAGAAVAFAVSGGSPELRVPPLAGMEREPARQLLESVGFDVAVQQVRTGDMPEGAVARTDPPAGAARTLPAVVTLLINAGVPADSLETEPPGSRGPDPEVQPIGAPGAGSGAAGGGRR